MLRALKGHSSYFVTINQQFFIPTTTRARRRKSKHIDIKFLVVKERVQSGQLSIEHIGQNSMIADPLTKELPPKVFHEHVARMGFISVKF